MSYKFTKKGNPNDLAIAVDGNKYIYLQKQDKNEEDIIDEKLSKLEEYRKQHSHLIDKDIFNELEESIINNDMPISNKARNIYKQFMRFYEKSNDIYFEKEIYPVPYNKRDEMRDSILVYGAAGSGKSTWIGKVYCFLFNRMYPKSTIFFISPKDIDSDKAFNDVKNIKQVDMESIEDVLYNNEETENKKSLFEYFKCKSGQSLVIFDDMEGFSKKEIEMVSQIMDSILFCGRSSRIFTIITRHIVNDGAKTSKYWIEANKVVFFKNSLPKVKMQYAMEKYLGYDTRTVDKLLNLNTRWLYLNTTYPKYYITQNRIGFIN